MFLGGGLVGFLSTAWSLSTVCLLYRVAALAKVRCHWLLASFPYALVYSNYVCPFIPLSTVVRLII
ncbi:hypothetical protein BDW62DRAFT_115056 [Aspergillus aurantiobrunneus]